MKSKEHGHNRFVRIVTIPLRVLGKARDLYVRSLTNCASRISYGQSSGEYGGQYAGLPRSFSTSSVSSSIANEDYRELMRAASARSLGHSNEIDMFLQQQLKQMGSKGLPKSCSVGMGRIDEDKPCELFKEGDGDDDKKKKKKKKKKKTPDVLYPRSKSYAANKGSVLF